MPFAVLNTADATSFDQSEPDAGDFRALGERSTGVLTGCAVAAQATPAASVAVAAGTYLIAGTPYSTPGNGSLPIAGGEANPRFDLVCGDVTGTVVVIRGVASTNPSFPVVDPLLYCLLSSVYVRQSVTTIAVTDVVDKRVSAAPDFRRLYPDTTTVAVSVTDSAAKTTSLKADGTLTWVSSLLHRLGDTAMEFATTLTVRAVDVAINQILILKARSTVPALQNAIEVQPSASTTPVASISGTGVAKFDNFKRGSGSPEGFIVGVTGDIYSDIGATDYNTALYFKIGGGNTGWKAMQVHDTTGATVPVGSLFAIPVAAGTSIPGYAFCGGASQPIVGAYAALFGVIGYTFGGSGANFNLPDLQGYQLTGAAGALGLIVGAKSGPPSGAVKIKLANVPPHAHQILDPGHTHPMPGFPYIWKPPSEPTLLRPYPAHLPPLNNNNSMPYMDIWPFGEDIEAKAGISSTLYTGGNTHLATGEDFVDPLNVLGPTVGVAFFIKT